MLIRGSKSSSTQIILREIQAVEIGESEHMQVARRRMSIMSVSLDRLYELGGHGLSIDVAKE